MLISLVFLYRTASHSPVILWDFWISYCPLLTACEGPCLYYSIGNTINSINLSAGKTASSVVVQDIGKVIVVAMDVEDNYIYWSDSWSGTIKRMDLQTNIKENVTKGVGKVGGIAIDWISKDIFWTDTTNNRIEMAKLTEVTERYCLTETLTSLEVLLLIRSMGE